MLAHRYGHAAQEVLEIATSRPELARPILDDFPDLLAEVVFGARREQALTVADVLLRRTRLGVLAPRKLCESAPGAPLQVARAMGGELGWDELRIREAVAWFRTEAEAEGLVVAQ
jgi:glycerol-3-phosphate dehydrogenase